MGGLILSLSQMLLRTKPDEVSLVAIHLKPVWGHSSSSQFLRCTQ